MITAVDTSILLDLLAPSSEHYEQSLSAHVATRYAGEVVISEAVYAEVAARFPSEGQLAQFLDDFGVNFLAAGSRALWRAGNVWRAYTARRRPGIECGSCGRVQRPECIRCGERLRSRQHVLADFLIGAHAESHADRLHTRDLGYYKTYFPDLELL